PISRARVACQISGAAPRRSRSTCQRRAGSESSSQSASRASIIVDPLHPVSPRTGGDLGQRLFLWPEAWKRRERKNSLTGLSVLVRELSGRGRGTRSPDLTIMSRAL